MVNHNFTKFIVFPAILLGSSFGAFKNIQKVNAVEEPEIFDYSKTSSTKKYKASEILNNALPSSLLQLEADYIDSRYSFKLDELKSPNFKYAFIDNNYWVEAFEESGFTPEALIVENNGVEEIHPFERINKQLIAHASTISNARVRYVKNVKLSKVHLNNISNIAYNAGKTEYENMCAIDEFNTQTALYNQYVIDQQKYDTYVSEKNAYDLKKSLYDEYVIKQQKYEQDLANYNEYVAKQAQYVEDLKAYNNYVVDLDNYLRNKDVYEKTLEKYNSTMEIIDAQLLRLDEIFHNFGDLNLSMFYFFGTDAVNSVIRQKDKIILAGVDATAVDACDTNTKIIKPLLTEYKQLRDLGNKADMYGWYQKKGAALRNAIVDLTRYLEYFYTLSIIRNAIEGEKRTDKYVLFVAELMYFSELISDNEINSYKGSYKINDTRKIGGEAKTYPELLKANLLDTTVSLTPLREIYPTKPNDFTLIEPSEVTAPVAPTEVKKPIAPSVVLEPTKPEEVSTPSVVLEPVNPNVSLIEANHDLALAYKDGNLVEHAKIYDDFVYEISNEIELNQEYAKNGLILVDTRLGTNPREAKIREIIYFDEPSFGLNKTNLVSQMGYFTSVNGAPDIIFGSSSNIIQLDSDTSIEILDKQSNSLSMYTITWNNVVLNSDFANFEVIDSFNSVGFELSYPQYNLNNSEPHLGDVYEEGTRRFTFEFVGYDYTNEKDTTNSNLSGLNTCDEISDYQDDQHHIVVNAVFRKTACYEVSFGEYETNSFEEGTALNAISVIPTKEETNQEKYNFIGWSTNGVDPLTFPIIVSEDLSLSPLFERIQKHTINFKVDDEIVNTEFVANNEMPTDFIPEKDIENGKYFEFSGWNEELVLANEDKTYLATFIEKDLVENANTSIASDEIVVIMTGNENVVNVSNILNFVKFGKIDLAPITIELKKAILHLSIAQISYLLSENLSAIKIEFNNNEGNDSFAVSLLNKSGLPIYDSAIELSLILKDIDDVNHASVFENNNEIETSLILSKGLKMAVKANESYSIFYSYTLSIDKNMSVVEFEINDERYTCGTSITFKKNDIVTIIPHVNNNYVLNKITALSNKGEIKNLNNNQLTVDSDITLYADVSKATYEVDLYVDGKLYSSSTYVAGTICTLPSSVYKPATKEERYVFIGWDKEVTVVDDNYVLNALFEAVKIEIPEEGGSETNDLTFGKKFAIGAISAVFTGIVITLIVVGTKSRAEAF